MYFPIWSHVNGLYRKGDWALPPLVSHSIFCRPSSKALEVTVWTYDETMLTRFPGGSDVNLQLLVKSFAMGVPLWLPPDDSS